MRVRQSVVMVISENNEACNSAERARAPSLARVIIIITRTWPFTRAGLITSVAERSLPPEGKLYTIIPMD